jgi:hypothetical protein
VSLDPSRLGLRRDTPLFSWRGGESLFSDISEMENFRSVAMSWLQTVHPVTVVVIACGFLLGASLTLAVINH